MLKLSSPFNGKPIQFNQSTETSTLFEEIMEIMNLIVQRADSLRSPIDHILSQFDGKKEGINKIFRNFNRQIKVFHQLCPYSSLPNLNYSRQIIDLAYRRCINEPRLLQNYRPFSSEVYGETLFPMIEAILNKIEAKGGVLLDLGSGVGNVCLHFAASRKFDKCVGIEKLEIPYNYSKSLVPDFYTLMSFFGQSFSPVEILEGDFLDSKFRPLLHQASLIFVNNYSFSPDLDNELKNIFSQLKNGTQIISSRSFCGQRRRRCDRAQNDISAMMHVSELFTCSNGVSWTREPVTYYLHVIDTSLIDKFYSDKKLKLITKASPNVKVQMERKSRKTTVIKSVELENNGCGSSDMMSDLVEVFDGTQFSQSCVREICRMKENNAQKRNELNSLRNSVNSLEERLKEEMERHFDSVTHSSFTVANFVRNYNTAVDEYLALRKKLENEKRSVEELEAKQKRTCFKHLDGVDDSEDGSSSLEEGEIASDDSSIGDIGRESSEDSMSSETPVMSSGVVLTEPVDDVSKIPRTDLRSLIYGDSAEEGSCKVEAPDSSKPVFHEKLSFKISKPLKKSSQSFDSLLIDRPLCPNMKKPKTAKVVSQVEIKNQNPPAPEVSPPETNYWSYEQNMCYPYYNGGYYPPDMSYYYYGCQIPYGGYYYMAYGNHPSYAYYSANNHRSTRRRQNKRKYK